VGGQDGRPMRPSCRALQQVLSRQPVGSARRRSTSRSVPPMRSPLPLLGVANVLQAFEVPVLCPEGCLVRPCRRQDDAVSERKAMGYAERGRAFGEPDIEVDYSSLLHEGDGLQDGLLAALTEDDFGHFDDADGGYEELRNLLDGGSEEIGAWPVRQVLEPAARIDEVHKRSGSRSTVVSIPLRNPRISRIERTGMSSIRFSCSKTCSCSPGRIPIDSLTSRGMTTWNFGETVTVGMPHLIDRHAIIR